LGNSTRAGLEPYVSVNREKNCYTWFLEKQIQENTVDYNCTPVYDLCFIDGPKNWTIDGLAFFLVDKLLREKGFIVFDDYQWKYSECSNPTLNGITIREMSDDQIAVPNIELVFQLLVMQHPDYSQFVVDEDWAWAQKVRSDQRTLKLVASQSVKYKVLKKYREVLKKYRELGQVLGR
jgi:predicted O-methyltransferase YrrM